jgi:hypothetical protein
MPIRFQFRLIWATTVQSYASTASERAEQVKRRLLEILRHD